MQISNKGYDTDKEVEKYIQKYGVLFPSISGAEGGGASISQDYEIDWVPATRLISPDREIVFSGIDSIDQKAIMTILEEGNIDTNDCDPTGFSQGPGNKIKNQTGNEIIREITDHTITISVPRDNNYSLSVYSLDGSKLNCIFNSFLSKGTHRVTWSKKELSDGLYIISLNSEGSIVTKKCLVNR